MCVNLQLNGSNRVCYKNFQPSEVYFRKTHPGVRYSSLPNPTLLSTEGKNLPYTQMVSRMIQLRYNRRITKHFVNENVGDLKRVKPNGQKFLTIFYGILFRVETKSPINYQSNIFNSYDSFVSSQPLILKINLPHVLFD